MTSSPAIDDAIAVAEAEGNMLVEVSTGWSKVREVAHMRDPIGPASRSKLGQDKRLRAWASERTPHNRADEGFTDDVEKVSISFPVPEAGPGLRH